MATSLRNHVKGKVKEIVLGPAVGEVEIETAAGTLCSVITTRSLKELDLKVGDEDKAVVTPAGVDQHQKARRFIIWLRASGAVLSRRSQPLNPVTYVRF